MAKKQVEKQMIRVIIAVLAIGVVLIAGIVLWGLSSGAGGYEVQVPPPLPTPPATKAPPVEDIEPPYEPEEDIPPVPVLLPQYLEWYDRNSDFIGWVRIPGTTIDHPVLQESPDELDFYLNHNIDRERCTSGVPFIWALEVGILDAENVAVYGHNFHRPPRNPEEDMVFSPAIQFKEEEFFHNHTIIELDTRYEERSFELLWAYEVAVVNVGTNAAPFFRHFYLDPVTRVASDYFSIAHQIRVWESEEQFYEHVRLSRLYTYHDTGAQVQYGDTLVRLITCTRHPTLNTRLVIVARLID